MTRAIKQLPWTIHSNKGFVIQTELKASTIEGGGLARFSCEARSKGDAVFRAKLISAGEFVSEYAPGTVPEGENFWIGITHSDDLDLLVKHFAASGSDVAKVEEMLSWFVSGLPPPGSVDNTSHDVVNLLCAHSNHLNHSFKCANVANTFKDDVCTVRATQDIAPGDELLMDYRSFTMCEDVKEWFARGGYIDTRSLVEQLNTNY